MKTTGRASWKKPVIKLQTTTTDTKNVQTKTKGCSTCNKRKNK